MKTEEHLDKILAFCRSRLALAEKRTSGKWQASGREVFSYVTPSVGNRIADAYGHNGDFVAACAGAAEAGWRATIHAIDRFRQIADMAKAHPVFESYATWAEQGLENILAAYPLELLETTRHER